jgi:hypothetical protein
MTDNIYYLRPRRPSASLFVLRHRKTGLYLSAFYNEDAYSIAGVEQVCKKYNLFNVAWTDSIEQTRVFMGIAEYDRFVASQCDTEPQSDSANWYAQPVKLVLE